MHTLTDNDATTLTLNVAQHREVPQGLPARRGRVDRGRDHRGGQ